MKARRLLRSGIIGVMLAGIMAGMSAAQVYPPGSHPVIDPEPTARPVHPLPAPVPKTGSPLPLATPTPLTLPGRTLPGKVPLWTLPELPAQTAQNTAYFASGGVRRRMAANGATISYAADTATAGCSSAVGSQLPTNCDVKWQSASLPSGTYQDYFITINANVNTSSATTVGSTYTTSSGSAHCDASTTCPSSVLTTVGTYVLATYDTATSKWSAVVYVSVGSVNVFGTYADSAATTPQNQFTASNTTNVYINATGLTQGQNYVVYIESTQGPVFCEYIAPPGTPSATQGCDPTTSAGITAVVGAQNSAAITAVWPLSTSVPTGTYAVVLYNLTTSTRLAMRQMSITGSSATGAIALTPVSGNPAVTSLNYNPTNPGTPYSTATSFAFDNALEQSDKGWSLAASGLSASRTYTWSVSDPSGYVLQSGSVASNSSGALTQSFTFGNTQDPSDYAGNVYTVQLYNQLTGTDDASQSFKILGYNVATTFTNPPGTAEAITAGSSVTTGIEFQNDGDTVYGTGNSDTIRGIYFDSGGSGIQLSLNGVTTNSCGGNCTLQTTTFNDSAGNSWNVNNECRTSTGNGGCTLFATPVSSSNSLAVGGNLTITNVLVTNSVGSHCSGTCNGTTNILPTHGESYSSSTQFYATNLVYFTNGFGTSYSGTASVTHYGYFDGTTLHTGQETHAYNTNSSHMTYLNVSPFSPASTYSDEWAIAAVNNSSAGSSNVTQMEIQLPTSYTPGSIGTTVSIDNASALVGTNTWQLRSGSGVCPSGAPGTAFCIQTSGSNTGITANGGTQTIYLRVSPPPPTAYSYTDWTINAIVPATFGLSATTTFTGFAPNTSSYDSTATAGYSLYGNLITPGFSPTSQGINTTNAETINVTNASTAQDPNPDYLDVITIDLPCSNGTSGTSCFGTGSAASYSSLTTGWSFLGEQTNTPSAGTTRYWFGITGCSAYFTNAASGGPPSSTPPSSVYAAGLCSSANETSSALAPGKTFSVTANFQTAASAGTVTAKMYAHGANGNGWSDSHTFTLSETSVAAAAGFTGAGGYPTATTLTSPNSPQVGADTSATNGNAFSYTIKNNSGTGQNLTSAIIEIPGKDISSVTPNDGTNTGGTGTPWTIVGTPAISGTSYSCSVSAEASGTVNGIAYNGAYSASNTGTNGGIAIGGGSCSIPPGSTITITFNGKAPYTINDSYRFTTTVNGSVTAAETWSTATIMQIIETASLSVAVNPSSYTPTDGAYSLTPTVSCSGCSFNTSTNTVDFGSVSNSSSKSGQDVLLVSVNTDAGSSQGWQIYVYCSGFTVGSSCNPSTTGGAFANEMVTALDNLRSGACTNSCEPKTGMTFNTTSYTVVPSTSPGLELMNTGSGLGASRDAWQALVNIEINMGTEAIGTGNKSTIVYTFIGN